MMQLRLEVIADNSVTENRPYVGGWEDWCFCYPLSNEGVHLYDRWTDIPYLDDSLISGLLADWITDHRSELLTNATGPSDPAVRLDQLIEWLRNRFNSQFDQ